MSIAKRRFPIPILWVYIFAGPSCLVLFLIATAVQAFSAIRRPGLVVLASAFAVFPTVFYLLHKFCVFLEFRGLLYYRRPKTGNLTASTILDLETLFTGRTSQIENVRMARESLNEGTEGNHQGDVPQEKQTYRHE